MFRKTTTSLKLFVFLPPKGVNFIFLVAEIWKLYHLFVGVVLLFNSVHFLWKINLSKCCSLIKLVYKVLLRHFLFSYFPSFFCHFGQTQYGILRRTHNWAGRVLRQTTQQDKVGNRSIFNTFKRMKGKILNNSRHDNSDTVRTCWEPQVQGSDNSHVGWSGGRDWGWRQP